MLPERADNWITHLGSRSYLADVMQAGVKVYFYKKGFLHSKLMVSDDMLSTVGNRTSKIYGVVFFFRLIYTGQHTDSPSKCLKSAIIVCDFLIYCNIVNKNVTKL